MLKEEFIYKISRVRKDCGKFYGYHLLPDKFLSSDKVSIECPLHGIYTQRAGIHRNGSGCPECSGRSVVTREKFLKKAKCKLKGVDIDTLEFNGMKENFRAFCYKHGWYESSPMNVYRGNRKGTRPGYGNGCYECNMESKRQVHSTRQQDFVKKFYENFPSGYSLKGVEDIPSRLNMQEDFITTECELHGEITKIARYWWQGFGCNECGNKIRKLTAKEDFLERFKSNFSDLYTIKDVGAIPSGIKLNGEMITASCKYHGEITKIASHWWAGYGCQKCAYSSFWLDKKFKLLEKDKESFNIAGFVYVSEIEDFNGKTKFYKIGITKNDAKTRVRYNPHNFIQQVSYSMPLGYAFYVEQSILNIYEECRYVPSEEFDGKTECLTFNPSPVIEEIIEHLDF